MWKWGGWEGDSIRYLIDTGLFTKLWFKIFKIPNLWLLLKKFRFLWFGLKKIPNLWFGLTGLTFFGAISPVGVAKWPLGIF